MPLAVRKSRTTSIRTGRLIAKVVRGSWRSSPPILDIPELTVHEHRTTLLQFGSGGLVWWKLRASGLKTSELAQDMRQAFRLYALRSAIHEQELARVMARLRNAGVESVLAKGWALAGLYPHPGLRPYGDIDICVSPGQYEKALDALGARETRGIAVDVHRRFRELEYNFERLLERSIKVEAAGTCVRVLSPEDHLRLVAIHMLYHGAWVPLWLCDVAVMMETLGNTMDWGVCLDGDQRRTEWLLAAMALAHQVLGAELPEGIRFIKDHKIPDWMVNGLYEQWGQTEHYMQGHAGKNVLRQSGLIKTLRGRWPNPLQATVRMGAPINDWPRFPFQLADIVKRAVRVLIERPNRSRLGGNH